MATLHSSCRGDNDVVITEASTSLAARIDSAAAAAANGIKDEPSTPAEFSDENSAYGTAETDGGDDYDDDDDEDEGEEVEEEEEENGERSPEKQKQPIELEITGMPLPPEETTTTPLPVPPTANGKTGGKKSKKRNKDVWTTTSRKGKKRPKNSSNQNADDASQQEGNNVLITPVPRFPDREDDAPDLKIWLSKVYKAERVELGEDRMTAASSKGYRMVRATRGVADGAWYFEIKVLHLGKTGHARLGWSTDKGDLQAPVGYDRNSFAYRDIDGSKVHKALREKYGAEGYKEGDVIGFYINLPEGGSYAPKPPRYVWYKGQRYVCAPDDKEDHPKIVPGSEITYYKNGSCQGVAFKNLYGGRYYPAASMYTLPNQPNCIVKFNFGPDFECFPDEFVDRPVPRPMIEVPYQSYDSRVENGVSFEKKQ